ncbi:ATP-binding protein [Streptomyces sp. AV19]|uniref:ATP-binding protein n=1 Tax=Streptomyces sp. AV19 TaxID=2793068 RepID=UPI0018FE6093|nr:ATP-binding protein [Streptomyces sp. AV19]MBH1934547.1 ATP-binding protein [Streptomyces sp. AV19]MDG4530906.1 ATP-binding protein [Streptomyces sp. AV19]
MTTAATLPTPTHEPTRPYQLLAPAIPASVRLAREFVAGVLETAGHQGLVDDARLCVSDVVSNVVQHAGTLMLSVQVTDFGDHVEIAVRDDNPTLRPHLRAPDEGGRGLLLVRELAAECGLNLVWDGLVVVGKCLWFELRSQE